MKRFISMFVLCTICFLSVCAQQRSYSSGQLALRENIMSYLREEGYQPSLDSDGDIKFKRQGDLYYIKVSDTDSNPYYVRLTKYYNYSDNIGKSKVNRCAPEINKYKTIKLVTDDESFSLGMEMFVTNYTAFTSVIDRVMRALDAAEEELVSLLL